MTTLIKNVQVFDGSGEEPYRGDIFIKNDTISALGDLGRHTADRVINASGLSAAPGFIDVHTSADHYLTLFTDPGGRSSLLQGVTTALGGMCGSSLAPLLYGELTSIRKWAGDTTRVNVGWKSMQEFLKVLTSLKLGVNFGTLMGHSTVRRALIGEELRDLTGSELDVFGKVLHDALSEGAFGFSTGLSYVHSRGAPHQELLRLAKTTAQAGRVHATHLRDDKEGLEKSIEETITLARETKAKTVISHFRPLLGREAEYRESLQKISEAAPECEIYFDLYPFDRSLLPVYTFLPKEVQDGGFEIMLAHLKKKSKREEILKHLKLPAGDDIVFTAVPRHEYLAGKTLAEVARRREVGEGEALLRVMEDTRLRATAYVRDIDATLLEKTLVHPRALVGANGTGAPPGTHASERDTKTFTHFLSLATKKNILSLPEAIRMITSKPALFYRIPHRGMLREGYKADITLFEASANGVEVHDVFVAGEHAVKRKAVTDVRAGGAIVPA